MINHQACIKNIKNELRKLTTLVNEQLPHRNPNLKSQPHEMEFFTKKEVHSERLMTHVTATKKYDSYLKEEKPEAKI